MSKRRRSHLQQINKNKNIKTIRDIKMFQLEKSNELLCIEILRLNQIINEKNNEISKLKHKILNKQYYSEHHNKTYNIISNSKEFEKNIFISSIKFMKANIPFNSIHTLWNIIIFFINGLKTKNNKKIEIDFCSPSPKTIQRWLSKFEYMYLNNIGVLIKNSSNLTLSIDSTIHRRFNIDSLILSSQQYDMPLAIIPFDQFSSQDKLDLIIDLNKMMMENFNCNIIKSIKYLSSDNCNVMISLAKKLDKLKMETDSHNLFRIPCIVHAHSLIYVNYYKKLYNIKQMELNPEYILISKIYNNIINIREFKGFIHNNQYQLFGKEYKMRPNTTRFSIIPKIYIYLLLNIHPILSYMNTYNDRNGIIELKNKLFDENIIKNLYILSLMEYSYGTQIYYITSKYTPIFEIANIIKEFNDENDYSLIRFERKMRRYTYNTDILNMMKTNIHYLIQQAEIDEEMIDWKSNIKQLYKSSNRRYDTLIKNYLDRLLVDDCNMKLRTNNNIVERCFSQFKSLTSNKHNINYITVGKLVILKSISYSNIESIINNYSSPSLRIINEKMHYINKYRLINSELNIEKERRYRFKL